MVRPEMLVSRVATVLREKIHERHWGEFLPGERRLSERLGVSRGTVREALSHLRREGLIAVAIGRQTRITARPTKPRPATSRIVGLVTNGPAARIFPDHGLPGRRAPAATATGGIRAPDFFRAAGRHARSSPRGEESFERATHLLLAAPLRFRGAAALV
jgi:DNA-binding transcriptional MocR family regulator